MRPEREAAVEPRGEDAARRKSREEGVGKSKGSVEGQLRGAEEQTACHARSSGWALNRSTDSSSSSCAQLTVCARRRAARVRATRSPGGLGTGRMFDRRAATPAQPEVAAPGTGWYPGWGTLGVAQPRRDLNDPAGALASAGAWRSTEGVRHHG